jgi:hydrogenase nickel incorporation protein HypA/HybF
MHEFSLAQNIIEIVQETLKQNRLAKVTVVELEIGTLSGVEIEALDMALESLQPGSVIEGALVNKHIVKGKARCKSCQFEFEPDDYFAPCPVCGDFGSEIIKGKELKVRSIMAE